MQSDEIIRDLQSAPTPAILRVVDSRSKDRGNDGFFVLWGADVQPTTSSSWKFRRDEIPTLVRPAEIIRDLQRAQMLAISRVVDSRSRDCGNDRFLLFYQLFSPSSRKFRRDEIPTLVRPAEIIRDLQRAQMLAISRVVDSRSRDCGNDGVLLCDQLSRPVILEISSR
jgi:hypothetical protein